VLGALCLCVAGNRERVLHQRFGVPVSGLFQRSMKLYVVRGLTAIWVIGTFYVSVTLFFRTDIDQSILTHDHLPHKHLDEDDPILLRRQVVKVFQNIHQGAAKDVVHSTVRSSAEPLSNNRSGWSAYFQYRMTEGSVWPREQQETNDRILNQLHHIHAEAAGYYHLLLRPRVME
jgi:hypothetical protein